MSILDEIWETIQTVQTAETVERERHYCYTCAFGIANLCKGMRNGDTCRYTLIRRVLGDAYNEIGRLEDDRK